MNTMTKTCLQCGQPRPYADSVYKYDITTDPQASDAEVWAYCQSFRPANHRRDGMRHDGSCGFPFGLDSYGSLRKMGSTTWRYEVTEPYCD